MAYTFTKDIETGNITIDNEHKQLFDAINQLLDACSQGKGRTEIATTIKFLQNYTRTHFSNEERMQIKENYPDKVAHKKYHTEFIATVDDIAKRIDKDGPSIAIVGEINSKIGSWLIKHIKQEDKKFAQFIVSK